MLQDINASSCRGRREFLEYGKIPAKKVNDGLAKRESSSLSGFESRRVKSLRGRMGQVSADNKGTHRIPVPPKGIFRYIVRDRSRGSRR